MYDLSRLNIKWNSYMYVIAYHPYVTCMYSYVSSEKWINQGQIKLKILKYVSSKIIFKHIKKSQNFLNTLKIYPWSKTDCTRIFKTDLIVTFYVLNNIFSYSCVVFAFFLWWDFYTYLGSLYIFWSRKILIYLTCYFCSLLCVFYIYLPFFIYSKKKKL